ncbi:dienelactone hydrolase family protein [Nocardioides dongxiaopingii]|uniref:dienelactone hydrolase family protein n=1 Tax=Nocardioides dongxiaopingii TaxID=2576036 RepID=UPI0010C762E5|nr:alpha/beta fold hydrolase [Nocardioides dongxiaopingii]
MDTETTDLTLDTPAGAAAAHLAAPVGAGSAGPGGGGPAVLVLHAWWGLNDDFRRWCDDLAAAGFTALAPDLFGGRVATTVDEADALRRTVPHDTARAIVEAARDELLARTGRDAVAVVGASLGAGWAVELAEADPAHVDAVVLYYGAAEAEWSRLRARVLHHFGDRDEMDPLEYVEQMQQAMVDAGLDATLEVYPGAEHWFAEPGRPEHHPEHAATAWARTVAFLGG